MILLRLFWEFFKTGLFAVGGGMATVPFLQRMAEKTGWFTTAQLADMIAVSESTPGPIGINMATYVGFTTAGIPGSVIATLGLITPCILVILLISRVLEKFRKNRYVEAAFYALRPCSVGLIGAAGLLVAKISFLNPDAYAATGRLPDAVDWKHILLGAVLLTATRWVKPLKKIHPVVFILASALIGIVFSF